MKKKLFWMALSSLMALSLVLSSCAPAVTEREKKEVTAVKEEKKEVVVKEEKKEVAPGPEVPKYGGVLTTALHTFYDYFDDAYQISSSNVPLRLTNEQLEIGDWTKGPAGTGETDFIQAFYAPQVQKGNLAESWEFPDPNTIIVQIRKGVHWSLNPDSEASRMVGGRELVAEDVAHSIRRSWAMPAPALGSNAFPGWLESAEATDKYTVVIKGVGDMWISHQIWERLSLYLDVLAPEVIEKYGDARDWRNSVGTGPFMLVDVVPSSSQTYIRNPNYWDHDPYHPENQLPYLDGVKFLTIKDASTRMAALRTGKLDVLGGKAALTGEDAEQLMQTRPDLKWSQALPSTGNVIFMRSDQPDKPWADIRVRRALSMAIDHQSIVDQFYAGQAETRSFPVPNHAVYASIYTPTEELPQELRELYEYHPDKAKQLLAEAGYPDGFQTELLITAVNGDIAALYVSYWDDVGIDVELKVLETGAFRSVTRAGEHTSLILTGRGLFTPWEASDFQPGQYKNYSNIDDPWINDTVRKIWSFEYLLKPAERDKLMKELAVYAIEQAYHVVIPLPYRFSGWWPWVQNYHGEDAVGGWNYFGFPKWVWYDPELKKEMGY